MAFSIKNRDIHCGTGRVSSISSYTVSSTLLKPKGSIMDCECKHKYWG